jgi:hypothetical protein
VRNVGEDHRRGSIPCLCVWEEYFLMGSSTDIKLKIQIKIETSQTLMSSLRLALKMSIEDSRTPETKSKSQKASAAGASSSSSSSSSGAGKQKRKRDSQNSDEKSKKSTKIGDEEVESDAETEDSLKIQSDQEEIVKGKTTSDKRKKKSSPPPPDKLPHNEKSNDSYDGVELLIASRQTPPIGTQTSAANSTSKKAPKERPKTPVMVKTTKSERNVSPIISSPSPDPEINSKVEIQRPIPTFISQTTEEPNTDRPTPEPIKVEALGTIQETAEAIQSSGEPMSDLAVSNEQIVPQNDRPETPIAAAPQVSGDGEDKDIPDKVVSSKKSASKRKRRGGLDLAEAEEIPSSVPLPPPPDQPEKVEEPEEGETTENNRIPSRAAAMAAKSKINTSKPKPVPEVEVKKAEEPLVAPIPETPSLAAVLKAQWVACDKCGKWRRIPGDVDLSSLPEQWFCTMNM